MSVRLVALLERHAEECGSRGHAWCSGTQECAELLVEHRRVLERAKDAVGFDVARERLTVGDAWPDERWSTTALLRLVKTEALEPPHRDPARRILRVTSALARLGERGLPTDAVIRTCLGPALVRRILIEMSAVWLLVQERRLPRERLGMVEAWLQLLDREPGLAVLDDPSMSDVFTCAVRGETAKAAREWLRTASVTHVLQWRLDSYLRTVVDDRDLALAAGAGATQWVVDRFTETYLDDWSRESLDWELVFLHTPDETAARVGLPRLLLEERPVTAQQVLRALSARLSGAVGDDPVAQGLRTHEIVEAIVGKLRDDDGQAAREMAEIAAKAAPDNPHLVNALAFCLIASDRPRSHRLLDRLDTCRNSAALATAATNRATLYVLDGKLKEARAALAVVQAGTDGNVWCWDPNGLVGGELRLVSLSRREWCARMSDALGAVSPGADG